MAIFDIIQDVSQKQIEKKAKDSEKQMKAETLKKAILQYAMQGKLVEQDPNDEPASVLLERIRAEKEQLIKDINNLKNPFLFKIAIFLH